MKLVLMLVAVLAVSLLLFKGYSSTYTTRAVGEPAGASAQDPRAKSAAVESLLQDSATLQRQAIEQQAQ